VLFLLSILVIVCFICAGIGLSLKKEQKEPDLGCFFP
jgi:hypothetical protein